MEEREIRGVWDDRCIRVYQAYSPVIAGEAVRRYVSQWTLGIADITPYVKEINDRRRLGEEITALLQQERVYLPG